MKLIPKTELAARLAIRYVRVFDRSPTYSPTHIDRKAFERHVAKLVRLTIREGPPFDRGRLERVLVRTTKERQRLWASTTSQPRLLH